MKVFDRMSPDRLAELLAGFSRLRVAVIGDFCVDKYLDIDPSLDQTSVETGKVAHHVVGIRHSPGGAGTVTNNLGALGPGALYAIGWTGDDGDGYELRRDLVARNCDTKHLHQDPTRVTCTFLKPHNRNDPSLAGEHSRLDMINYDSAPMATQQRVIQSLNALLPQLDAVMVQDQMERRDCGVVTGAVRNALAAAARRYPNVVFWADSRRHIYEFRGLTIKPNQFEAVELPDPPPGTEVTLEQLLAVIPKLQALVGAPVCVTRGPDDVLVSDGEMTAVPAVHLEEPLDITGAGDSFTSGTVLALAAGATLVEAALVGNLVASITIQQLGATGVARPDQLPPRLALWQAQRS